MRHVFLIEEVSSLVSNNGEVSFHIYMYYCMVASATRQILALRDVKTLGPMALVL